MISMIAIILERITATWNFHAIPCIIYTPACWTNSAAYLRAQSPHSCHTELSHLHLHCCHPDKRSRWGCAEYSRSGTDPARHPGESGNRATVKLLIQCPLPLIWAQIQQLAASKACVQCSWTLRQVDYKGINSPEITLITSKNFIGLYGDFVTHIVLLYYGVQHKVAHLQSKHLIHLQKFM